MKTIIAVTFIGILTYAFAESPSTNPECKYQAMANFDSIRYLQMTTLYRTHTTEKSNETTCEVINSATVSNGKVDIITYGYRNESGDVFKYEVVCNTTEESFKTGQYPAKCTPKSAEDDEDTLEPGMTFEIDLSFELDIRVMDTDYENYAIIDLCSNNELGLKDNIVVYQKNPNAGDNLVKEALNKMGLKIENFNSDNYAYCQNKIN